MRAMVTPWFGAPDLFEERDVEMPRPGPGEVLVRVVASGANPIDAKFRAAGPDNQETLKALGADVAIDYTHQEAAEAALDDTGGTGVDVVLDAHHVPRILGGC
jgi:NADPH:quinone reductase-like Zn-dependent oxidoreductase